MAHALNKRMEGLDMPARIRKLPISKEGYPVPWFVQWLKSGKRANPGEGEPDFRVMDPGKMMHAIKFKSCWVCGEPTGVYRSFVIGPMCAINRASSEPPSHFECAEFSVRACPFMTQPRMVRNKKDLPEGEAAGVMIERNPGVSCIWITKKYETFRAGKGILFQIGEPIRTLWYKEGRTATREEIMESIDSGYPLLQEMAVKEGVDAVRELSLKRQVALKFMPAE